MYTNILYNLSPLSIKTERPFKKTKPKPKESEEEEEEEESEEGEEEESEEGMDNHGVAWLRGPLISRGGFGSVYLAKLKNPRSKNRLYPPFMAVKSAEVSASATLQKEKEVFNALRECPYIIKCFGEETTFNEEGGMVYNILLEYASGGTLASLIGKFNDARGLSEFDVKRFTRFILKGLDFIHRLGYVHCDLKPENILLVANKAALAAGDCASNFVAKIGDFGLAKKVNRSRKRKYDPFFGGTALYMAPETVMEHIQEPPSDIWALGCLVLEMLTGKPAWNLNSEATTQELRRKIGDPYELPKIPSHVSKDAKDFLKACLVRKSMFRWTAEMLLDHPFVSGLDDQEAIELFEIIESPEVESTPSLSRYNDEFYCCSFSEDCSFTSEENSSSSSWLDDVESSENCSKSYGMVTVVEEAPSSVKRSTACPPIFITSSAGAYL